MKTARNMDLLQKIKKNCTGKGALYIISAFFITIKIIHLIFQRGILWDSAAYMGMGKYIFSLGHAGLWEPARPVLWPIILGFLWKIRINPLLVGRILEIGFGAGCILLTYLIGKEAFDKNSALLGALFLALSPTFLFYSSTLLTGIPSTFFALLAVYLFVKEKYILSGMMVGVSCMTRFLQLFVIVPMAAMILVHGDKKAYKITMLLSGAFAISIPYLIFNLTAYKNPIYPFLLQAFMTKNTGWIYHRPFHFYLKFLLTENLMTLFSIIGAFFILKKKDMGKSLVLGIFAAFFIFFMSIAHKETRFALTFLPYLYLISAYGAVKMFKKAGRRKNTVFILAIMVSALIMQSSIGMRFPNFKEYPEFKEYIKNEAKDGIWISNPIFISESDKKADEIIYYPIYNSDKITQLKSRLGGAKAILIDSCDILPCPPSDVLCLGKTSELLSMLKEDFKEEYNKKEGDCEGLIFSR
ncbi:glycosyltransferase family 39 protein [Candidatus Woesearchaeota archaeon]|nr:glycosyltransferase family 39 protein [Candidatus Woesearchaeota archaeon]